MLGRSKQHSTVFYSILFFLSKSDNKSCTRARLQQKINLFKIISVLIPLHGIQHEIIVEPRVEKRTVRLTDAFINPEESEERNATASHCSEYILRCHRENNKNSCLWKILQLNITY